jgi:Tfp pilus assembly protein PilN
LKNDSPTTPPEELEKAEQVLVLPGHLFFIESVEVPAALEAAEIADFAELSLESIAPFPIEQLYWGYLYAAGEPSILLYATHRDRLKNAGMSDLNQYVWVLPDFATLEGACLPDRTEVILKSAHSLALLHFDQGQGIPRFVTASPWSETDTEEAVLKVLRERAADPEFAAATTLKISPGPIKLDEHGLPTFAHAASEHLGHDIESGAWSTLTPTEKQLWQADVRGPDFKTAERNNRRFSARLIQITGWAALFAVILIVAELLLLVSQAWLGTRENKIASQQSAVLTIEDKQSLMNKLEQVAQNELRPVAILDALNQLRPAGIYFTSTETDSENRTTIDGIASTINELNNYTDLLSESGNFELIGTPKSITRSGKTTFTVTLAYKHTPAAVTAAEVIPQEAAEIQ